MKFALSSRWLTSAVSLAVATTGLVALAASSGAAPAKSSGTPACAVQSGPTRIGRVGGLARPLVSYGRCTPSGFGDPYAKGGAPPLIWHNGPVMSTKSVGDQTVVTPIYWAGSGYSFTTSYQSIINRYLADVAADSGTTTNVFSTLFEYSGSNGAINYRMSRSTPILDTHAFPAAGCVTDTSRGIYSDGSGYTTCLDDAQVQAEINSVVTAKSLPRGLGHVYVLFLPKHVQSCLDAGNPAGQQCTINTTPSTAYCAYHSEFNGNTVYANMPFPIYQSVSLSRSCTNDNLGGDGQVQAPNGDKDADVEVSPTSHEIAEAITDPDAQTGWYDKNGYENGDDCAYVFGAVSGTSGSMWNQLINGHRYMTQEEFSNADFKASGGIDGCLQRITAKVPSVTALSKTSGAVAGGTTVTITGSGFPGTTSITFGGVAGTAVSIIDAKHVKVTTPAHSAGTVDVRVTTAAGTSPVTTADRFTFS